jgi:DNA-binding transcriptional regulator YiaG
MHNLGMPNIATALRAEIARVARKELRGETESLKKSLSSQRTEIVALKRRIQELEKLVRRAVRAQVDSAPKVQASSDEAGDGAQASDFRFRAKGMASNRARLGLSAADFGLLVGATGQSVYAWEAGKSKPRANALAAIASLRGIGKKEAAARLATAKGSA